MQSNKDSKIVDNFSKFLTVMMGVAVLFMVLCFFGSSYKNGTVVSETYEPVVTEIPLERQANGTRVGYYQVNTTFNSGDGLIFYTSHSMVDVYDGDKRIYQFGQPHNSFFWSQPWLKVSHYLFLA